MRFSACPRWFLGKIWGKRGIQRYDNGIARLIAPFLTPLSTNYRSPLVSDPNNSSENTETSVERYGTVITDSMLGLFVVDHAAGAIPV